MRNSTKQRVINECSIIMSIKEKQNAPKQEDEAYNSGLTLAQKIKMLVNLNSVQFQTSNEKV